MPQPDQGVATIELLVCRHCGEPQLYLKSRRIGAVRPSWSQGNVKPSVGRIARGCDPCLDRLDAEARQPNERGR